MVTTYGVKHNIYSDIAQSQVTLEHLFASEEKPATAAAMLRYAQPPCDSPTICRNNMVRQSTQIDDKASIISSSTSGPNPSTL